MKAKGKVKIMQIVVAAILLTVVPKTHPSLMTAAAASTSYTPGALRVTEMYEFYHQRGLSDVGIAALLGSFEAESAFIPSNVQNTCESRVGSDLVYTNRVDSGEYRDFATDSVGFGLAQWTSASRKAKLLTFARTNGTSIGDGQMQMMFALQELKQDFSGLYQKLCSTSITLEEAARAVTIQFENPRDKSDAVIAYRTRLARECYAAFPTSAPIQTAHPILDVTTLEAPPAPFLITDTPAPAPFMLATLPTPPCPTFETPSITVTAPVLEETLTPAPCPVAEAAVTAPVIEETPAPPPAPEQVYCEVGMTPAPCPTAQTPACTVVIPIIEDAMATAPPSSDNVIHCEDGMTPAPCPTVEAIRCEDGMTPAPCPTVEAIRCEEGMTPAPCPTVEAIHCEDGMTPAPCPTVEASSDTLTAPPLSFLIPFAFLD